MTARTIGIWVLDHGTGKRITVPAYATPVAGLVIVDTPLRDGLWSVTHERSGASILTLPGPEAALHAAVALGGVADWTLPGSLLRDLPGLGPAVRKLARELDCYGITFKVGPVSDAELALTEAGGA